MTEWQRQKEANSISPHQLQKQVKYIQSNQIYVLLQISCFALTLVKSSSFSPSSSITDALYRLCPVGICLDDWWIGIFYPRTAANKLKPTARHPCARFFLFYTLNDILAVDQKKGRKQNTRFVIITSWHCRHWCLPIMSYTLDCYFLIPSSVCSCRNCLFSFNNINHTGSCVCSRFLHPSRVYVAAACWYCFQLTVRNPAWDDDSAGAVNCCCVPWIKHLNVFFLL